MCCGSDKKLRLYDVETFDIDFVSKGLFGGRITRTNRIYISVRAYDAEDAIERALELTGRSDGEVFGVESDD